MYTIYQVLVPVKIVATLFLVRTYFGGVIEPTTGVKLFPLTLKAMRLTSLSCLSQIQKLRRKNPHLLLESTHLEHLEAAHSIHGCTWCQTSRCWRLPVCHVCSILHCGRWWPNSPGQVWLACVAVCCRGRQAAGQAAGRSSSFFVKFAKIQFNLLALSVWPG